MTSVSIDLKGKGPGSELWYEIGTAYLADDHEFIDQSYPTASWYQKIQCQRGQRAKIRTNGYWVCFGFEGTITASHFPSSIAGNPMSSPSSGDRPEDIGKERSTRHQMYLYQLAGILQDGGRVEGDERRPTIHYRLYEGVEIGR